MREKNTGQLVKTAITLSLLGLLLESSPARAQGFAELTAVAINRQESRLEVKILLSKPVFFKSFTLTGPDRLVIDLFQVNKFSCQPLIPVSAFAVERIRVAKFQPDITRVVFDFSGKPPLFSIEKKEADLTIIFWAEKIEEKIEVKKDKPPLEKPVEKKEAPIPVKKEEEKVPEIKKPEEIPAEKKQPKLFQVELLGGFSRLSPSDLNLRAEFELDYLDFYYDGLLNYYKSKNSLASFSKQTEGNLKKLENTIPFGLRLRFNLSGNLAVSLGFKYFSSRVTSSLSLNYDSDWYSNQLKVDIKYSPFVLMAKAYAPLAGIHFGIASQIVDLEVYLTSGPLFAECSYSFDNDYRLAYSWGYEYRSAESVQESGRGIGFGIDGGIQLNFPLGTSSGFFLETGYAFQKVGKLSGPGSYEWQWNNNNGDSNFLQSSWSGEWEIKGVTYNFIWQSKDFSFPSSKTEGLPEDIQKIRPFSLDLSGYQARLGFFFRF